MTWDPTTECNNEQIKIAPHVVRYLQGRALDLGCGRQKVWPSLLGIDNGGVFGAGDQTIEGDISDLSLFADASVDALFSSHAVEDFAEEDLPALFREWTRVLKTGGHLVLYVPSANLYPKVGEPGANRDHKWNIYPGDLERHLCAATSCGWTQLECEERGERDEYSLFEVYRKRDDGQFVKNVWERNPGGLKRALVIRYGAIGDQIIASSILPGLKAQGYHVTYNTTPDGMELLINDPHIDDWIIQAKDWVPNQQLGILWDGMPQRYDHIINLCESIEGSLLALPGRLNHMYSDEARRRIAGGVNYLERTHDIAGVPRKFAAKFYPGENERLWAADTRAEFLGGDNAPLVVWAINGSSFHKTYPWVQIVLGWLMQKTPCHVVLTSDGTIGKQLQDGMVAALGDMDTSRIHCTAGLWPIRKSLTFALGADCVVGPETGVLNAVSLEAVPKVIYLSHSSAANLTKHWRNTITLEPDRDRSPCYPCHRMHYGWEFCPQDELTHASACASAIPPDRVFKAIAMSLGAEEMKAA